jgi:hypothetical protein
MTSFQSSELKGSVAHTSSHMVLKNGVSSLIQARICLPFERSTSTSNSKRSA